MNYADPVLRDRLASEYVLGTLHGSARRRFEALMAKDRALANLVGEWQDKLVPLASALPESSPSPQLLEHIEQRLGFAPARPASKGFLARVFGWQPLGMVAAGVVIGVMVTRIMPAFLTDVTPVETEHIQAGRQLPASYVGILSASSGKPSLLISSLRRGTIADVKRLTPLDVPSGQAAWLWGVKQDGTSIRLGTVPDTERSSLTMPATSEELLSDVTELAVSFEAAQTTPAQPTQPYVLRGPCGKFW